MKNLFKKKFANFAQRAKNAFDRETARKDRREFRDRVRRVGIAFLLTQLLLWGGLCWLRFHLDPASPGRPLVGCALWFVLYLVPASICNLLLFKWQFNAIYDANLVWGKSRGRERWRLAAKCWFLLVFGWALTLKAVIGWWWKHVGVAKTLRILAILGEPREGYAIYIEEAEAAAEDPDGIDVSSGSDCRAPRRLEDHSRKLLRGGGGNVRCGS